MYKILKPILMTFLTTTAVKRLVVDLLKSIAKQTTNTLDDKAVAILEKQLFPSMKITKFLNIDIEPAPLEMKLDVEMRCREIMASNEINDIKKYCTHLVRHKLEQDVFLASMLNRLIELEAAAVVKEIREKKKTNPIKKFFRIL